MTSAQPAATQRTGELPRRPRHHTATARRRDEEAVETASPWRARLPPRLQEADRLALLLDDPAVDVGHRQPLSQLVDRERLVVPVARDLWVGMPCDEQLDVVDRRRPQGCHRHPATLRNFVQRARDSSRVSLARIAARRVHCGSRRVRDASRSKPRRATAKGESHERPVGEVDESDTAPGGFFCWGKHLRFSPQGPPLRRLATRGWRAPAKPALAATRCAAATRATASRSFGGLHALG